MSLKAVLFRLSTNAHCCVKFLCTRTNKNQITTAGIIVIGDEILKGQVHDTNSFFIAQELHNMGLKLKKISVIGDDVQEVAGEVRHFSKLFDYVITTGGIGPTHDDVTYEAVASAFNEQLYLNNELKAICERFYKTSDQNSPGMKLAYIPESSVLTYNVVNGEKVSWPTVSVKNVYIFPGIPELLRKSFNSLGTLLFESGKRFYTKCVYLNCPEEKIAKILDELNEMFPDVNFGSYPKLYHSVYKVKVTIESNSENSTKQAYLTLLENIPKEYIVNYDGE